VVTSGHVTRHTIRSAIPEIQANFMDLCSRETNLLPIKVLHYGNTCLLLRPWSWPWPDDFHIRTWSSRYTGCAKI